MPNNKVEESHSRNQEEINKLFRHFREKSGTLSREDITTLCEEKINKFHEEHGFQGLKNKDVEDSVIKFVNDSIKKSFENIYKELRTLNTIITKFFFKDILLFESYDEAKYGLDYITYLGFHNFISYDIIEHKKFYCFIIKKDITSTDILQTCELIKGFDESFVFSKKINQKDYKRVGK